MRSFNDFIENSELIDISILRRKFTCYKPNGLVNSRINRILLRREWLDKWSNSKQFVLGRLVSDHCTLVLRTTFTNWGPKPFRSLDIWQKDERFEDFICISGGSYEVQGSGMFCF